MLLLNFILGTYQGDDTTGFQSPAQHYGPYLAFLVYAGRVGGVIVRFVMIIP
jgi:hypothetical protein